MALQRKRPPAPAPAAGSRNSKRPANSGGPTKSDYRPRPARSGPHVTAAVNTIVTNCGSRAKRLLRSDHPRLPAPVVLKIARTHPDRQCFALTQARAGRDPLGPPPPGVPPPFDTRGPGEVLSRLARNAGALDKVADGLLDLPVDRWPTADKLSAVLARAEAIARQGRAMKHLVRSAASRTPGGGSVQRTSRRHANGPGKPFDPRFALRDVAAAAGVTGKNARDLPRVLADTPPTGAQREALLVRLGDLEAAALRLAAVIRSQGHDNSTEPSGVFGTYVVFFRLAQPQTGLKIGALGTFDFPAGVYAYLGSAFGSGGVRTRTGRHLTPDTKKKWNIDWLKPHCVPVAVWWAHDRQKVEFQWAEVMASLPGASFPAKGFGAANNKTARAHLVRFVEVPAFEEFQRRVSALALDHADVHRIVVANWAAAG